MKTNQASQRAADRTSILHDERGLSTVEYVVLLVLICAGCVALWATFGEDVYRKLQGASDQFNSEVDADWADDNGGENRSGN